MSASTITDDVRVNRLVLDHLRLADALARRYGGRGEDGDDLVQVARVGLVHAARRYEPRRGPFSPYASATISGELKRHFRDHAWLVRPPRGAQELILRIGRASGPLQQDLRRAPRLAEIAAELDGSVEQMKEAMVARGAYDAVSLDDPGLDRQTPLSERLGAPETGYARVEAAITVERAVARLSRADREIVRQRFVLCRSQADIARRLGLTQMAVSRRLVKILATLRAELGGGTESDDVQAA